MQFWLDNSCKYAWLLREGRGSSPDMCILCRLKHPDYYPQNGDGVGRPHYSLCRHNMTRQSKDICPASNYCFIYFGAILKSLLCSLVVCRHPADVFSNLFMSLSCPPLIACLSVRRLTSGDSECDKVHWTAQSPARYWPSRCFSWVLSISTKLT